MTEGAYDQASWHPHAARQPVVGTPGQPRAFTEVPSGPGLGQCLNLQTTQISPTAVLGSVSQNVRTCLKDLLGGAPPISSMGSTQRRSLAKATHPYTLPSGCYFCVLICVWVFGLCMSLITCMPGAHRSQKRLLNTLKTGVTDICERLCRTQS